MDSIWNNNLNQNDVKDRRIKTHFVVWDKKMPSEIGLQRFQKVIERKYNKKFESYWDLHKWSIQNFSEFWKEIWNFFDIIVSKPYEKVFEKTGHSIIDNDWFCGATFNIAENFLRNRDNTTALSYTDEFENKGEMTFAEMFEEVKLYASAFRRNGLRKGDRIGGYISNVKEAVFAFLAALSIGAIWCAVTPYLGPRGTVGVRIWEQEEATKPCRTRFCRKSEGHNSRSFLYSRECSAYNMVIEDIGQRDATFILKIPLILSDCHINSRVKIFYDNTLQALFNMMKAIEPKFLIVVDHFFFNEEEFFPVENLTMVIEGVPNLEKIIIVSQTANAKSLKNFSNIPKGVLLEDFLESGRSLNGSVPDLIFEQLPPSYPAMISFTSGTTGIPKGVVHSHVAFIGFMRDFVLHYDLKNGDAICNYSPPGWAPWVYGIPSLALGVKLFLFNGSPTHREKVKNFWDLLSENKITYIFFASCDVNEMEFLNIVPGPNTNLDCLKIITMSGSPPLPKDYNFLLDKVKKDLFVGIVYGSTELMATFSAINLNMPAYACESQVPALGVDLRCFDSKGNSVVGQRGEMVVTTPTPYFPIYLWDDKNNERMQESYFIKYGKGIWCQNDEGYFNPETKGFSIIGRSDNMLKQYGQTLSPDDIYVAIDHINELKDFICVCQDSVCDDPRNILFVQLKEGYAFTPEVKEEIKKCIQQELSALSVPEVIMEVSCIPRNINHKRMESLVKKIVMTNTIPEVTNIRNPDCLKYFCDIPEIVNYK